MSTLPSIRVIKNSAFKGGTRNWSNRYTFAGGTPVDSSHWLTLSNAVTAAEKAVVDANATIVETIGYASGSDVPVFSHVYSLSGTLTPGTNDNECPLQDAALIRWTTSARSIKNHPIYAFSYIHNALYDKTVGGHDKLAADQKSALQTYATQWVTGFSDGTITAVRATPGGHICNGSIVEEYITHRDFPYRSSV